VITAEHIERAERILKQTYAIGTGDPRIVCDRARVERDDMDNFLRHHKDRLFNSQTGYMRDVDPRIEPAILTMLTHFFAVGAIAQRVSEGKS
jgi:hypothetical protein